MRILLQHSLMLAQQHLYRRHSKQARVEGAVFFAGISLDVKEVHTRKATMCRLDMDLDVFITHSAQHIAAVVEHIGSFGVALTKEEQVGLVNAVSNSV